MKYFLFILLVLAGIAGKAQMKGDTTKAESRFEDELFQNIVLLMQENKELSDRLDRAERRIDTLTHDLEGGNRVQSLIDKYQWEHIDSLEKHPYLFIDNKGVRPGLWLTNYIGEYQIFVSPLK